MLVLFFPVALYMIGVPNQGFSQEHIDKLLGAGTEVSTNLDNVARGDGNLLHPIRAALAADASIGEVCGAMRDVFGEYKGGAFF